MNTSRENLLPGKVTRLWRELQELTTKPTEGIEYRPQEDDVVGEVFADILGPVATPYEGGRFRLKLVLAKDHPRSPPRGFFLTKIFHPNVSSHGDICVNTLKKEWSPDVTIGHILQVVRCLLINPFPESALNDEASKLSMENYDEYFKRAAIWTKIHALDTKKADSEDGGVTSKSDSFSPQAKDEGDGKQTVGHKRASPAQTAASSAKRKLLKRL